MNKLIALLAEASGLSKTALASCVNGDSSINDEEIVKVLPKIREGIENKLNAAKEEALKEAEKANEGKTFEDGRLNGKVEAERKLNKALRDQFGIEDSKLSGDELFKAIAAKKETPSGKITKDQVERESWYQEMLDERNKAHQAELDKVKGEFDEYKSTTSRKERLGEMRKRATPIIEALNLNLSKDPERRAAQLEVIWEKLEADDYDFKEDRVIVKRDGKVLRNKMDNTVEFTEHVSGIATRYYEPMESKERGSAGVKPPGKEEHGKKSSWNREMPKNDEQYQAMLMNPEYSVEERAALMEAWTSK